MTARILVVDDILANRKLLETRLLAEYFEVTTAADGFEALEFCAREQADIVLLDVMMPGLNGFEVCKKLKSDPKTQNIPVIMITALDQPSDKVFGLQAGADDFLTKPVDDIALVTRVRNLARLKRLNDELMMRASTRDKLGFSGTQADFDAQSSTGGRVLLVEDHPRAAKRIVDSLGSEQHLHHETIARNVLPRVTETEYDLVMISLDLQDADGLRLCSQIKSNDATRNLPVMILVDEGDSGRLLRGLDMGVNDYVQRPIDRNELLARVRTQVKRKRYADELRDTLDRSVDLALTDQLTGLHNRRYFDNHIESLLEDARVNGKPLSLMTLDIDHFKSVNDTYGHDVGDVILKEFSERLMRFSRGSDFACRFGGEEFVVIMPNAGIEEGFFMAERMRRIIADEVFPIGAGQEPLRITSSFGVAGYETNEDTRDTILKRADEALYRAKHEGRNRISIGMTYAATA